MMSESFDMLSKSMSSDHEKEVADELELNVKYGAQKIPIVIPLSWSIAELKNHICTLTNIPSSNQKLVGFIRGKLPSDSTVIRTLNLKSQHSFLLLGTPVSAVLKDPKDVEGLPIVLNDLNSDGNTDWAYEREMNTGENAKKLKKYIAKTTINIINSPRPGKRLLILDLDYTIFDCKSTAEQIAELLRPGTHEFLTAVYHYYDIVIWSQTNWKALEMKITELGILTHPRYKITFVLDKTAMFSIISKRNGQPYKHEVKALDIIWAKFPEMYSPVNSIHIDDLSRNFAMNPQSGLKILAFKNAPLTRVEDRELCGLAKYLLQLVNVPDFRTLNHNNWRSFHGELPKDFYPHVLDQRGQRNYES